MSNCCWAASLGLDVLRGFLVLRTSLLRSEATRYPREDWGWLNIVSARCLKANGSPPDGLEQVVCEEVSRRGAETAEFEEN